MTKKLLTFIIILGLTRSFACSCSPPSITHSYKGSVTVFIGQYLGQTEISNEYGLPIEMENFEVFRFFKGKGRDMKMLKTVLAKYNKPKCIVSLLSSAHSSCGYKFAKNKYYVIYAYKSQSNGLITTDGCISTHEIESEKLNDFLADSSSVPEIIKLNELASTDPKDPPFFEADSLENYVPKALLIGSQDNLQNEISKRNTILWVTIPTILVLLAFIVFRRKN